MNDLIYNWKRFWCSRDGGYHLDVNGFLYQSEYLKDTEGFESLSNKSCLILLGEPGIGKSQALKDAISSFSKHLCDHKYFRFDLRAYGNEERLYNALFKSEEIEKWRSGEYQLHLFLDSLDECLSRIDNVAALLVEEFGKSDFPVERLMLRIACRTADLPRILETGLSQIWKSKGLIKDFGIYELCPLQEKDAWVAAEMERIDANAFLQEVIEKNVGTLAARPITLRLLFNLYKKNNQLPEKPVEIYEKGCRVLCDEPNDSRRDSPKLRSNLSADQKLLIAGRVAALTVLCNRAAVWKGIETGEHSSEDILVRELVGGHEEFAGIRFPITENEIHEAIATGLFTSRGANRQGWSHQTFSEFLAAWYLYQRQTSFQKIIELTTNGADAAGRPAPQLAEMLGWLASMREDVREHLIQTDPVLLMRSDVASFSPKFRETLVEELLNLFIEEKEYDDKEFRKSYPRLAHPQLASQLRSYITNKEQNWFVRYVAIDIAQACNLENLQDELVKIVLEETEDFNIRVNAGYAVWEIADSETRKQLRDLALNGSPTDKDEELRGVALLSAWNEHISAQELFNSLVHSPIGFSGAYSLFLYRIADKISVEDLPLSIKWVREERRNLGSDHSIRIVMDDIMFLGWQNLDYPGVLSEFAQTVVPRLQSYSHKDIVDMSGSLVEEKISGENKYKDFLTNAENRRRILRAIAPLLEGNRMEISSVFRSQILRPRNEDLAWVLEELAKTKGKREQWFLSRLIGEFYGIHEFEPGVLNFFHLKEASPEFFALLQNAYNSSETVKRIFAPVFLPVEIDSDEAKKMKAAYIYRINQQREFEEKQPPPMLLEPTPQQRVEDCLARIESGELIFWSLSQELTLEADSQYYGDWSDFDITGFLGWKNLHSSTRQRVIASAKKFVLEGDPNNQEWVGTDSYTYYALAGYRALFLLLKESPEFIQNLSKRIWQKWAPIIISYPVYHNDDEKNLEQHQFLIAEAYKNTPDVVIKTVLRKISAANEAENDYFSLSKKLEVCWDEKFKAALREKLVEDRLKNSLWRIISEELLAHNDAKTQEIMESSLKAFLTGDSDNEERALITAIDLFLHSLNNSWWKTVWGIIQKNFVFGRKLVERASHHRPSVSQLTEKEVADFFIWLERQYPVSEDEPMPRGIYGGISTRQEIGHWRGSILQNLKGRGTQASLFELERIHTELSEFNWLKRHIIEAKKNVRRHTWTPPVPKKVFEILNTNDDKEKVNRNELVVKEHMSDEEIDNLKFNGKPVKDIIHLADFLKLYRNRPTDIVFFTGAGLSMPLFESWSKALEKLIMLREQLRGNSERTNELNSMLEKGQFLEVADICAQELGENAYRTFIEQNFDKDFEAKDLPPAYSTLLNLRPQTILTTNYDRIPEVGGLGNYRIYSNQDSALAETAVMNNRMIVFKAHGNVTQRDSIVFTSSEYQKNYQNPALKGFLEAIFRLKPLIFLGFGLTDPYFNQILENIYASNNQLLRGKYALLEGLSQTEIQSKEQRYGLNIIPYKKSDNTHPEVLSFVQMLSIVISK